MNMKCAGSQEDILNGFSEYLLERGKSQNTIKTYQRVLQSFCAWLTENHGNILCLTKNNIQLYISYLELQQKSVSTVEKVCNTLRSFARYINRPDLTQGIYYVQKRKGDYNPPNYLTKNEISSLLNDVESEGNRRNIAIVYTLLFTGIRVSELCMLNKVDIKIGDGNNIFFILEHPETYKKRTIPINNIVFYHLKRYKESRNDHHEALFVSNYKKRISPRTVQHMLTKFKVYPQILRHTFCYQLIKNGVDLSVVAQLAGHSDINITRRYMGPLKNKDLKQALEKMYA